MKKIFAALLAAFCSCAFATTFIPLSLINPAGSTSGQVPTSTGPSTSPVWGNLSATTLTGIVPVANGGTGAGAAGGTSLDNITGFSSTGFLTRTGAGTYSFQSLTNGIVLSNLAQAAANTVLANGTGSTANLTAYAMPSCSGSANAIQYASGTGFICGSNYALLASPAFTGTPAAPTATAGDNSTKLATTAYVQTAVSGGSYAGSFLTLATSSSATIGNGLTVSAGGSSITGGLTVSSGAITPVSTTGITGTTTNDSAVTGAVGEYPNNTTSSTSMSTGTPTNCTSKSLTAGDWQVGGTVQFSPNASTTVSQLLAGISTTSATFGAFQNNTVLGLNFTTGAAQTISTPEVRISLATTTTVYLVGQSSFGTSTMACNGYIWARRPR